MVSKLEKYYRPVECVLTLLLFALAVSYDAIHFPRLYTFIAGFGLYFLLVVFRMKGLTGRLGLLSYLLSIGCILLLEFNSRYIINYFIHALYILLMIELAVSLKEKNELWMGGVIIISGMYKYVELIQYKPAMSTYAEAAFFIMINAMSIFVITLMQGLREEQSKLIRANTKLEAYSDEVKSLTEVKTKADIASIIHDGVGHNLTALIMQLEMTGHLMDSNPKMAKTHLEAAKETARDNLVQIRKAVKTMDTTSTQYDFNKLIRSFSLKTGVKISWEIDEESYLSIEQKECVYRSIQEGLTNAVRHGLASEVKINLEWLGQEDKRIICLKIHDNGRIKKLPEIGYGLKTMIGRYEALGGRVQFKLENGLVIHATLPQIMEE